MITVKNIRLRPDEKESLLKEKIASKLKIDSKDITELVILHRSLDARKEAVFVYEAAVKTKNENKLLKHKDVNKYQKITYQIPLVKTEERPLIIGLGPSGLFTALKLVSSGIKPIIIERGKRISQRSEDVRRFMEEGILNSESNVQYGEGGAGTFSDAKLTTRIKDPYISYILDAFVNFGAKTEIRYDAHPHIGTDEIRKIIVRMTDHLITKGATIYFEERAEDLIIENGKVKALITNKRTIASEKIIIACGHSAYEFFKTLSKRGVYLENKDFSVGFRVEHPQDLIDQRQYKEYAPYLKKMPAEYFLRAKTANNKGVYSFCMCPGGFVVPSSCDQETIVTNGMSYSLRNHHLANSAILVQIDKNDYDEGLFAGFEYLHALEHKAYEASGSYKALSQNIKDYLDGSLNKLIFPSSYSLGTVLYDFNKFFDQKLNDSFHEALSHFDKLIPGFIEKGIMVGPETKSSCPIRIKRGADRMSINTCGLYPVGEGAGYAGGIMSSALDGVKTADEIINNLQ